MDTTLLGKSAFGTDSLGSDVTQTPFADDQCGSQLQQLYVRSKAVVSRRIAGETLIVPVRGKVGDLASIYSFNATGSLIWQTLESPKTLADLINAVQQEYAVSHEQAEQDVKQFITDTMTVGLVELREQVSMAAFNSTTASRELQTGS
jgi:hypothetical protein